MNQRLATLPRIGMLIAFGLSLAAAQPAIAQSYPTTSPEMEAKIRRMYGDRSPYGHKHLSQAEINARIRAAWGDPHPYQHKTLTKAQENALIRSMWGGPLVPAAPVKGKAGLPPGQKPLSKP